MPIKQPEWKKRQLAKEREEKRKYPLGKAVGIDCFPKNKMLDGAEKLWPGHSFCFDGKQLLIDNKPSGYIMNWETYMELRDWARNELYYRIYDFIEEKLGPRLNPFSTLDKTV